ncbi:hypothetical protein GRF29_103g513895 [Pseudopithomyces chartarum]|uniref:Uncharacterized protein n=1 Tax=Pseudopithomyces chartarum TaxID=1892770 RepID=A0AAN6LUF7_9PLEO|nr:hypothetical protein GRF29_103g513895 [Pseudopithomyces chartarum]
MSEGLAEEYENFINAVVDDASLDDAVAVSQVSRNELLCLREGQELPLLHLRRVECLSGRHRIGAAKAFLDENDHWWTVRLFSKNTPEPVLARIVESEEMPPDGERFSEKYS